MVNLKAKPYTVASFLSPVFISLWSIISVINAHINILNVDIPSVTKAYIAIKVYALSTFIKYTAKNISPDDIKPIIENSRFPIFCDKFAATVLSNKTIGKLMMFNIDKAFTSLK